MVDTGANVSVPPPTASCHKHVCPPTLQAVNHSPIQTYGKQSLSIDSGIRHVFHWIFLLAGVPTAILGANFLSHFNLTVDISEHKPIDSTTTLSI